MSRTRSYRGGWSTSICDLFNDPRRRSDCCAVTCCGLLLSDRNAHLVLDEQRPSWWKRFCWNIGMPVTILLVLNILAVFLATEETLDTWIWSIRLVMLLLIIFLLHRAQKERIQVRRALATKMYEKRHRQEDGEKDETDIVDEPSADYHLQLNAHDIRNAHGTCCLCFPCSAYPKDIIYQEMTESDDVDSQGQETPPRDLCTCMWSCLRWCCCGGIFGWWIQCCGMCAIGQEDRELERLLDPKLLQVDYITFQPFDEYYPEILTLRESRNGNLFAHWQALSLLSYNLMKILIVSLLALTIVALLHLDPNFQFQNLMVVLATFGQAFVVTWVCHWQWHRFDLSTDALVKYFASGFCLSVFLAVVNEAIVGLVVNMVSYLIVVITSENLLQTPDEIEEAKATFFSNNLPITSIFVFVNAYIAAATVEEVSKYFGFWMVDTPDLMNPQKLILQEGEQRHIRQSSLVSQGAGITVAMVAVATGFACSENLLYVFVYTTPSLNNEIATLLARSLFPIHPMCAAIQSIGVVKRDLEGSSKSQLGMILLPAIILHGSFDFVLMFLDMLQRAGTGTAPDTNKEIEEMDSLDQLSLVLSLSMVVIGTFYYFCISECQRKKLSEMDESRQAAHEALV